MLIRFTKETKVGYFITETQIIEYNRRYPILRKNKTKQNAFWSVGTLKRDNQFAIFATNSFLLWAFLFSYPFFNTTMHCKSSKCNIVYEKIVIDITFIIPKMKFVFLCSQYQLPYILFPGKNSSFPQVFTIGNPLHLLLFFLHFLVITIQYCCVKSCCTFVTIHCGLPEDC